MNPYDHNPIPVPTDPVTPVTTEAQRREAEQILKCYETELELVK